MIQVTPQMEIWMAVEAVDFRRGIDGLARVCREVLKADPFSGLSVCISQQTRHGHQDPRL